MILRSLLPLLVALPVCTQAQDGDQVPDGYVIEGHFDSFTTDEMGNVYALQGDELRLFDARGRSWLRNSVKTFGRIGAIDAFYSLKPLVFSPEQGQFAVLDNTLSLRGSVINLARQGYAQVVGVCMSVQNSFWFFDQRDLALVRVDERFNVLCNTGRLDQQLGFAPAPAGMQEHANRLYVNDPAHGVMVFDLFGTYMRTLPITGASSIEARDNLLWSFAKDTLHVHDLRTFDTRALSLPTDVGAIADVRVERGLLYMLTPERIVVRALSSLR